MSESETSHPEQGYFYVCQDRQSAALANISAVDFGLDPRTNESLQDIVDDFKKFALARIKGIAKDFPGASFRSTFQAPGVTDENRSEAAAAHYEPYVATQNQWTDLGITSFDLDVFIEQDGQALDGKKSPALTAIYEEWYRSKEFRLPNDLEEFSRSACAWANVSEQTVSVRCFPSVFILAGLKEKGLEGIRTFGKTES